MCSIHTSICGNPIVGTCFLGRSQWSHSINTRQVWSPQTEATSTSAKPPPDMDARLKAAHSLHHPQRRNAAPFPEQPRAPSGGVMDASRADYRRSSDLTFVSLGRCRRAQRAGEDSLWRNGFVLSEKKGKKWPRGQWAGG